MESSTSKELFLALMQLVASNEAFRKQDQILDNTRYRIFNYGLASYRDFASCPHAIECRGVMFEISEDEEMVRLAAWPMEKFFNLNENEFTNDLDLTTVVEVMEKVDGSLISTYTHNGELRLKSKGSLSSPQAQDAMSWLGMNRNEQFGRELFKLTDHFELTVNLEWIAPNNQVVIRYEEAELRVLNARSRSTGKYFDLKSIASEFPLVNERLVRGFQPENPVEFIQGIPDLIGIEGFVIRLASGQRVKIKTLWYIQLHKTKDAIKTPKNLFDLIVDEDIDDIQAIVAEDPKSRTRIEWMQEFVNREYNHFVRRVEEFCDNNKHLDRKDFVHKSMMEFTKRMEFRMAMCVFAGKSADFKSEFKKAWDTDFKAVVMKSPVWTGTLEADD